METINIGARLAGTMMVAAVAVAPLAVMGTAEAAPTTEGETTTNLNIRESPSSYSPTAGSLEKGQRIKINCKVNGTNVRNNNRWYALQDRNGWVSARYVKNIGAAPDWCPAADTSRGVGKTKAKLIQREGPTRSDAKLGVIEANKRIDVTCFARGEQVQGTARWYYLRDGSWVAAAYVKKLKVAGTGFSRCVER